MLNTRFIVISIGYILILSGLLSVIGKAEGLQEEKAFFLGSGLVEWSPNGSELVTISKLDVVIMNPRDNIILKRFSGHTDNICSVRWSPDGTKIASCAQDGRVKIWDVSTGNELQNLSCPDNMVMSVSWAPDGEMIASGSGDGSVIVWGVLNGTNVVSFKDTNHEIDSVAWSPDGITLAVGGVPGSVRLYDVPNETKIRSLSGHTQAVNSIAWSPDGTKLVTGSDDKTAKVWDTASGTIVNSLISNGTGICSVDWSPDGTNIATGDRNGQIRLWHAVSGTSLQMLSGHCDWVTGLDYSPDGSKLASASMDGTVRIWSDSSSVLVHDLIGHSSWVYSVSWSPDGTRLASASDDFSIKIWNTATGTEINTYNGHTGAVRFMEWSPDGTRIASWGTNDTISIWDPESLTVLKTIPGTSALAWSPDGRILATGSSDNSVILWDPFNGTMLKRFVNHTGFILALAWSPDGKMLASGSMDMSMRIWDVEIGIELYNFTSSNYEIKSISWSPDSNLIAITQDWFIYILNSTNLSLAKRLDTHKAQVEGVAWSPNGHYLASCADDHNIILWDGATLLPIILLDGHSEDVYSIAWSPNDSSLVSGSKDNTVKIWAPFRTAPVHVQDLLKASVTVSPVSISAGALANLTIQVSNLTDAPVSGASIDLSAPSATLSAVLYLGEGKYTSLFTAPQVTANTTVTITAYIHKTGMKPTTAIVDVVIVKNVLPQINHAPEIVGVSTPNNMQLNSNSALTFTIMAIDPDGDNLTYEWMEHGITLGNAQSITHKFLPGNHTLILLIGDGQYYMTRTFNFTVSRHPGPTDIKKVSLAGFGSISLVAVITIGMVVGLFFIAGSDVGKYSLMILLLPLYTRLNKKEVLNQEVRGIIRGCIMTNPGIHYNELLHRLGLGNGLASYHLMTLEREGIIKSKKDGGLKRFYPAEMNFISIPTRLTGVQKLILKTVQERAGLSQRDITILLELPYLTINRQIKKLVKMGALRLERKGISTKCYIHEKWNPNS